MRPTGLRLEPAHYPLPLLVRELDVFVTPCATEQTITESRSRLHAEGVSRIYSQRKTIARYHIRAVPRRMYEEVHDLRLLSSGALAY